VITFGRVEVRLNRWLIRVRPLFGKVALPTVIEIEPQKPLQVWKRSGGRAFGRRSDAEVFQIIHDNTQLRARAAVIRIRLGLFGHRARESVLLRANHGCAKRDQDADQRYC